MGSLVVEDYIETYTGIQFEFLDPQPKHFNIIDIAHALSMTCRYTGHCRTFYSVAEHSWHMARMLEGCSKDIQLAALLHDGSEAYLPDVASPIKKHLSDYNDMEDAILVALFKKYHLEYPMHPAIKLADRAMLSIEARHLLPSQGNDWDMWKHTTRPKIDDAYKPVGMDPKQAKAVFLEKYSELTSW